MLTVTSGRSSTSTTLAYVGGAIGLIAVVLGTFLPWLQSGDVRRNSYASFGVLQRLVGFHGASEIAIRVWPLIGLCCAGVVVAAIATWHRVATVLALGTAAWSGVVAGTVLLHHADVGVSVVALGPVVTLIGDAAVLLAATLSLIIQYRQSHMQGNSR
jgi:hypothetical protein